MPIGEAAFELQVGFSRRFTLTPLDTLFERGKGKEPEGEHGYHEKRPANAGRNTTQAIRAP